MTVDVVKRNQRMTALVEEYGDQLHDGDGGREQLIPAQRYVLVERNWRFGRGYWLTSATTPQEAGNRHVNQEYAEDWELVTLFDLDTGDRLQGHHIVTWDQDVPGLIVTIESEHWHLILGGLEFEDHHGRFVHVMLSGPDFNSLALRMLEMGRRPLPKEAHHDHE